MIRKERKVVQIFGYIGDTIEVESEQSETGKIITT